MMKGFYVNWGRDKLNTYNFFVENEQRLENVIVNLKRMGCIIYTIDKVEVSEIIDEFVNL